LLVDVAGEAKKEANTTILFHSVDRSQEVIDFIDRDMSGHFHALQAAIGGSRMAK
jgi:hypothetical protein